MGILQSQSYCLATITAPTIEATYNVTITSLTKMICSVWADVQSIHVCSDVSAKWNAAHPLLFIQLRDRIAFKSINTVVQFLTSTHTCV
jgi:hypothetical protein